ncbi:MULTISPECIES: MurR/RpiR family transcriptional regulator [Variovorax]|jgi:DNA-binding MurR/RpiR family transcriptional regulator|uniref:DNA-binding MurR/RpiR family transcriptional regulator n=2 Tax=Variovorax paradoxus TaxID=34073 RepID=A0AAW8EN86_VARPD|nr:MurR/RpiR family transcriptional regulator [Variovorax paradoxus]MBW8717251.1 MurR/RpiR family transcriptional regulator [Variovorax paradoxus]MDP9974508.1 DNA-binding MurR/RpiR family transcriptional regulator [Variovorax paradoxus]
MSADSFVRRVRSQLDQLPATERQLADFVLEFPGELASYAGNELAELAGVSPSTVSRFIRRIGYENYEEARRHVREEKQTGSPLFQNATEASKRGHLVATHFQQSQANLANTFERLDDRQMAEIVKAIIGAGQVLIFGTRSSHAFALYLRWQIIQVVPRVTAIPGPGETLAEHLAGLGERDCVIVFGLRRQTRQLDTLLAAAHRAGAKIVYISDRASPDFADATWSLQCDCRGPGLLDNHAAVMGVCDLIATMVVEAAGSAGRKRLAAIELGHEENGEL